MPIHPGTPWALSLKGEAYDNLKSKPSEAQVWRIRCLTPRLRNINEDRLKSLTESMQRLGQLQPIGVRFMTSVELAAREPGDECTMALIYGAHRLEAIRQLYQAALEGDDDFERGRWSNIQAVIYPDTMEAGWGELVEITENLVRYELDADHRAEQTIRLAAGYKRLGLVQAADAKRVRRSKVCDPNGSGDKPSLPTATEKLSSELGISDDQVRNRANAVGQATGIKISVEKSEPEVLAAAADKMVEVIRQKDARKQERAEARTTEKASRGRQRWVTIQCRTGSKT